MNEQTIFFDGCNEITDENGVYKLYSLTMDLRAHHRSEILDRDYVQDLTIQQVRAVRSAAAKELVKIQMGLD